MDSDKQICHSSNILLPWPSKTQLSVRKEVMNNIFIWIIIPMSLVSLIKMYLNETVSKFYIRKILYSECSERGTYFIAIIFQP